MRILIAGAGGQVGQALAAELEAVGDLCLATRQDFDLSHPQALAERLNSIEPELIVNAAAYTAVDKAETEREAAFTVNALAVKTLGEWSARRKGRSIIF